MTDRPDDLIATWRKRTTSTDWNGLIFAGDALADALEAAQKDLAYRLPMEDQNDLVRAEARVRQLEEALKAADALRERVRNEDTLADDFGRWREAAAYDDAREVLAAKENT